MTRLKNSRGFTLIELIVVIVIIGILVAIAAVAYNAVIENSKQSAVDASAAQVAKLIQSKSAADQVVVNAADAVTYLDGGVLVDEFGDSDADGTADVTVTVNATDATKLDVTRDKKTATLTPSTTVGGAVTVD